jgi:hypothetical protein
MKTVRYTILALSLSGLPLHASDLEADLKRLEALETVFVETQAVDQQFGDTFWLASKKLAEERGVEVLHAVMERSKNWEGEGGLVYVPLVALLPRESAVQLLKKYQEGADKAQKLWAGELLIEFEAEDIKETVSKYQSKKDEAK